MARQGSTLVPEDQAGTGSLSERKQQVVRSAIWEAAMDLFAEKGYDETTIEDIAAGAGVSRRSFFRYFSSKSDLMAYGIIGYASALSEAIAGCPASFSLAEVFRHTVREVARRCALNPRTRKIMAVAAKYPAAREAHLARTAELEQRVRDAYAARCSGSGAPRPALLAGFTLSVLAVVFQSWFHQPDKDISKVTGEVLASLRDLVAV